MQQIEQQQFISRKLVTIQIKFQRTVDGSAVVDKIGEFLNKLLQLYFGIYFSSIATSFCLFSFISSSSKTRQVKMSENDVKINETDIVKENELVSLSIPLTSLNSSINQNIISLK